MISYESEEEEDKIMLLVTLRMLYTPGEATFPRDLLSLIEGYKKDLEQVLSRKDPNNDAGATFARYRKNLTHANISIHNLEKQLTINLTQQGE